MSEPSREHQLREIDRREWRYLGYAIAFLALVALLVWLGTSGLLPPAVVGVLLVALLVGSTVLRFKALDAQVERGRLDPMTRGERAAAAGAALVAVGAMLGARSADLSTRTEVLTYIGVIAVVLGTVAVIDVRHRRRRRATTTRV